MYLGGPPRVRGGIRVSRGGIESGQVRGSAGGLEKSSAGVSGLVKKPLDCTVLLKKVLLHQIFTKIYKYHFFLSTPSLNFNLILPWRIRFSI